jgi:translation initiation factor 1
MCPGCGQPQANCRCRQNRQLSRIPAGDKIRVSRETKGRKGKPVTAVTGLPLGPFELAALAKKLKAACGAGGSVRDGVIEVQGEHRDKLVEELAKLGYSAKRSGG